MERVSGLTALTGPTSTTSLQFQSSPPLRSTQPRQANTWSYTFSTFDFSSSALSAPWEPHVRYAISEYLLQSHLEKLTLSFCPASPLTLNPGKRAAAAEQQPQIPSNFRFWTDVAHSLYYPLTNPVAVPFVRTPVSSPEACSLHQPVQLAMQESCPILFQRRFGSTFH